MISNSIQKINRLGKLISLAYASYKYKGMLAKKGNISIYEIDIKINELAHRFKTRPMYIIQAFNTFIHELPDDSWYKSFAIYECKYDYPHQWYSGLCEILEMIEKANNSDRDKIYWINELTT